MPHQRPLSPHIQIYKPQLTSVLSISHRLTGGFLALGAFVYAAWILALAQGPDCFAWMQALTYHFVGRTLLLGWTFAFFYHLCNGVRHLFWDAGYGFELKETYRSGWTVVVASIGLTLLIWCLGYWVRGDWPQ